MSRVLPRGCAQLVNAGAVDMPTRVVARVRCRRSSAGIARSSSCAVRRRRARERGHVVKEASRHGIQLSSADDSLPQSTAPIIVPRRLGVYRGLPQSTE